MSAKRKRVNERPSQYDPRRETMLEEAARAAGSSVPPTGGVRIKPREGWEPCPKDWRHTPEADRFAERRVIPCGQSRCNQCHQRGLRWATSKAGKYYLAQRWEIEWYDENGGYSKTADEPHFVTCKNRRDK